MEGFSKEVTFWECRSVVKPSMHKVLGWVSSITKRKKKVTFNKHRG
jgi:hypothetical protein